MEKAKDFPHNFLTPMNMTSQLTTKISAGMTIQRYLCSLNHLKVQQTHFANCGEEEVWDQPQLDCESADNQNHLNSQNNFPTDHVRTASGFAPIC